FERILPLIRRAGKLRQLGSIALSLAHTAAGGLEVLAVSRPSRIFDMAAGALMVEEVGGVVTDLEGRALAEAGVGLDRRTTLLCAADPGRHRMALEALRG